MGKKIFSKIILSISLMLCFAFQNQTVSMAAPNDTFSVYLPLVFNNPNTCSLVPTLIGPEDGVTLSTLNPFYEWNSGDDSSVTGVTLEAATNSDFSSIFDSWSTNPPTGHHTIQAISNYQPGTKYYWRVYFKCGTSQGPSSTVYSFTTGSGGTLPSIPTQTSPSNGSTGIGIPVTLKWNTVPGAVEYLVFYNTNGGNGGNFTISTSTQWALSSLNKNTKYYWWVLSRNSFGISDASPKWTFTTVP